MASVSFTNVSKYFGSVAALADLTLDVEPGEFVSLLGPSGSGKSTTLNLLAGLLETDAGEIRIGDRIVNDLSPDKRDLAMVFQNYALYPHMTVFENIAFPLRARSRRIAAGELEARVNRVADLLGVNELLHRYPKELSGGQQQRVALGRAMVRDPQVFLLDEPLSNLDARLRIRMRRDLKELHERIGSTIIYVTHDQAEAMSMSSRIAVFNAGKLQQYGSPQEIYNRPANVFVANFVGEREITLLKGVAEIKSGRFHFKGEDIQLTIPDVPGGFRQLLGRQFLLGVRAESVRALTADVEHGLPATVMQTDLSGPDMIVYARTSQGTELCCRTDASAPVRRGTELRLEFIPERLQAFDPLSEAAIPIHG